MVAARGAAAVRSTVRQFVLPLADEISVDLFAGGGGASTGAEQALGRHVDIAVTRPDLAQRVAA